MKRIFFLVKFFDNPDHADDFVRGRIFANSLSRFKQIERDDHSGRMDRDEGTSAWFQPNKGGRLIINGMDISDDLAGPLQIQMSWLNPLNIFCIHAAHSGNLDLANLSNDNIETLRQQLIVPDACFSLGKHAVIVKDVGEFMDRMRSSARQDGYRIARGLVRYYDPATFHGHFPGVEVAFHKQDQYSFQREYRFVFDTGATKESPLVMNIGNIEHITLRLESRKLNGDQFLGGKFELLPPN